MSDTSQKVNDDGPFGPVIYAYTRAQAIEDGVLVDVSETAREAGIKFPTALSAAVWASYVEVPDGVQCQDERGRLWDILFMLRWQARRSNSSDLWFELHVRNDNSERAPPLVKLHAQCHPGDDGEPVITVMMPGED